MMPPFTIASLATEVLTEIFLFCLCNKPDLVEYMRSTEHDEQNDEDYRTELSDLALRSIAGGDLASLERVCRRFREVVQNTPILWSSLTVQLYGFDVPDDRELSNKHHRLHFLLDRAIRRAKDLPLTLVLRAHAQFSPQTMEILLATAGRWQHITLDLPPSMYRHFSSLTSLRPNFPWLTTLRAYTPHNPLASGQHAAATLGLLGAFSSAAAALLTNLEYAGTLQPIAILPIEQLHRVRLSQLGAFDLRPLVEVMARMRAGSELIVELAVDEFGVPSTRVEEQMRGVRVESSVRRLDVFVAHSGGRRERNATHVVERDPLAMLFRALRMPHLESFAIHRDGDHSPASASPILWPAQPVGDMLLGASSRPLLRELHILDITISEVDLLALLSELPALRSLAIGDPKDASVPATITDALFQALAAHVELKHLELHTRGAFTDDALDVFLQGRDMENGGFVLRLVWIPGYERMFGTGVLWTIDREGGRESGLLRVECLGLCSEA